MEHFKCIFILIIFIVFFGCEKSKNDYVFEEFKSQIEREGMKIDSVNETGLIYISKGEITLEISLENVRKNFKRDNNKNHISDLVKSLLTYSVEFPVVWDEVKENIYISFIPNNFDFKDIVNFRMTDKINKVYVYNDNNELTYISEAYLQKWNITVDELENQALKNADRILSTSELKIEILDNRKLGMLESEYSNLKSAILLAPSMKEKVEKDFSYPFYAVIPVRDFCYIFSEKDFDFFSQRIGSIVVEEFKQSGYPITTEILKISETSIKTVGIYEVTE